MCDSYVSGGEASSNQIIEEAGFDGGEKWEVGGRGFGCDV